MQIESPLVSIIVPVFNVEAFLPDCLESIAKQSYPNIEVIIIDDGSSDNSGKIADAFCMSENKFRVFHQENKGVSSARNVGISKASGEYICFVDSDDHLENDYVDYLIKLAQTYDADISITTQMFSSYGDKQTVKEYEELISGEKAALKLLHYFIPIGCYCKLFKRSIIEKVKFIPDVYIGEGFNFNIDAFLCAEKVAVGNRKIYKYRRDNAQSVMTVFKPHKCEMALRAIEIIHDKLPVSDEFEESYRHAMWHTASNMHDWIYLAKAKHDFPELFQLCRQWVQSYSHIAFHADAPRSAKVRAFIQSIHPDLMPFLIKMRRKIFL